MKIVCFIASVIKDERRLKYFRHMLDSIRAQTTEPTNLYISIHIAFDFSETEWKKLFANLPGSPVILRQKQPKKQFVQYRELLKRADDDLRKKETFIMFSDDDDLWHPMRVQRYMEFIEKAALECPDSLSRMSAVQSREETEQGLPCQFCQQFNESNVDAMLLCGCIRIATYPYTKGLVNTEYHQFIVKPYVLQEFLELYSQLVDTNRFTDMQFRNFVCCYKSDQSFVTGQLAAPHWMYYYRKCDTTYNAVTNPVGAADDFEAYIQYLNEAIACPAMGPAFAKKCIASCDARLWPVLILRVKGL